VEEVIERDLVQRRARRVRRDVAADSLLLAVCTHHHRHRVPTHEALDAALELLVAGIRRLLLDGDRVDLRRVRGERDAHAAAQRVELELAQQALDAFRPLAPQDVVEGVEPIARLRLVDL
jgi:hypothetical protein